MCKNLKLKCAYEYSMKKKIIVFLQKKTYIKLLMDMGMSRIVMQNIF